MTSKVKVITFDLKTGKVRSEWEADLTKGGPGHYKLKAHIVWCANNAMGVQIYGVNHEQLANRLAASPPQH